MWVPVVEKAYAKAHQNYRRIEGGRAIEAVNTLAGLPS